MAQTMGALFGGGGELLGIPMDDNSPRMMRPMTAPIFGNTIPTRIKPPATPPTGGGRHLRLWSSFGLSDLHVAVIAGSLEKVKTVLASNPGFVNEPSGFGYTSMHMAAGHGKVEAARVLLEAGAAVEVLGDRGYTPLHLTAIHGHEEMTKLLLENGSDPSLQDIDGFCAIHLAARAGHAQVVQALLDHGIEPMAGAGPSKATPMHLAARFGHSSVINTILNWTQDIDVKLSLMAQEDANGRNPLQASVHKPECQAHMTEVLSEFQKTKEELEAKRRAELGIGQKKGKGKGKGKGKAKEK